jgi:hypothetical protein
MPPQQHERLLDLGDDGLDFGAHIRRQISGVRLSGVRYQVSGVNGRARNEIPGPMPDPS